MKKMQKGTICMVIADCIVDYFDDERNIRGHLVYGENTFSKRPYVMNTEDEDESFIFVPCKPKDMVPIDPRYLNVSLSSAYRKSRSIFGRLNPFLEVPLAELRGEYKKYAAHFAGYLASSQENIQTGI